MLTHPLTRASLGLLTLLLLFSCLLQLIRTTPIEPPSAELEVLRLHLATQIDSVRREAEFNDDPAASLARIQRLRATLEGEKALPHKANLWVALLGPIEQQLKLELPEARRKALEIESVAYAIGALNEIAAAREQLSLPREALGQAERNRYSTLLGLTSLLCLVLLAYLARSRRQPKILQPQPVAQQLEGPLTIVNGYCDLLLETMAPDDPLRREIEQIGSAGARAARILGKASGAS
jgi:hypothetical protein